MKTLRQIKGEFAFEQQGTFRSKKYPNQRRYYGHLNVVFNRPLYLTTKVCHTIETETDSTDDIECFVLPNESPTELTTTGTRVFSSRKCGQVVSGNFTFKYIFGYCGDHCPGGRHYGGEILELFLKPPTVKGEVC